MENPLYEMEGRRILIPDLWFCRLLDRSKVETEDDKAGEDEEDNDLLKAFKVGSLFSFLCGLNTSILRNSSISHDVMEPCEQHQLQIFLLSGSSIVACSIGISQV
jgi:hypothetical protein